MSALTDAEIAVQDEFEAILASAAAITQYENLDGAFGGRLLNADLCRDLSPRYQNFHDRVRFTRATYAPAAKFVRRRFDEIISTPGDAGGRQVLFLAGGAASGKTTSIGTDVIGEYNLIFDSNLADFDKARRMIRFAADSGWFVDVRYIHRPYDLALRSMIDRALNTGRYIPVGRPSKLAELHFNAQRTIVRLWEAFAGDRRIGIEAIANLWRPDAPVNAIPISISDLNVDPTLRYNGLDEIYEIEAPTIELLEALCGTSG
jgi:hypothetical protein